MKPIIGIVARPNYPDEENSELVTKENYRKQIIKHGGIPIIILPPKQIDYNNSKPSEVSELNDEEKDILVSQLNLCDGILMPGGYKVFSHDFFILDYAINHDIPMLGICLGMQIMSNYKQEYFNEKNNTQTNHFDLSGKYMHTVKIEKNSRLHLIINREILKVNSMHNYHAIKGGIYNIVGVSEDGLIEALELPNAKFNIGVQWHPEIADDEPGNKLFEEFIKCSKR